MKIGLHSVTYLGLWYDGPGLTPLEFLRRARQLGYSGVELDGRRPHASPIDLDPARRRVIRDACAELELDLVALAANTDLSTPVLEQREAQLLMLREQIRLARELGAPLVRVCPAWPGITVHDGLGSHELVEARAGELQRDHTWLGAWSLCRAGLREAVRFAEEEGIVLALQYQPPLLRDHRDLLEMIAEVDSPWLGACIDAPAMAQHDEAAMRQAIVEIGPLLLHVHVESCFMRGDDGQIVQSPRPSSQPPVNYPAFVRALHAVGYDRYLCFQWAQPAIGPHHEVQGIEFIDQQAQLALEYLRGVLAGLDQPAPRPAE